MQREIRQAIPLLTAGGQLAVPGWARTMRYFYDRDKVRSCFPGLKEWNFYQLQCGDYVLQLTLGHVTYMCSITATLIDLTTGQKRELGAMKPFYIPELDTDPEGESVVSFDSEELQLRFQVTPDKRTLDVHGHSKQFAAVDIHIELENDPANEKMVIATPFKKPNQFYLNYKENYYRGTGSVRFDGFTVSFDGCTGLVDWGRGVWPYCHEWYWGSLTNHIDGVPFGFNIGWGFGDLTHATENMFFYNKKATKLGVLQVERDEQDLMRPWRLRDPQGLLDMTFTPFWDNYTQNKFVVVDTHCDQLFGAFDGTVLTADGPKHFTDMTGFIEHAVNRW